MPPQDDPRLDLARDGRRLLARFLHCQSLSEVHADRIGQALGDLATEAADEVVIDLLDINYVTSTIVGHFINLARQLRDRGSRLVLDRVQPPVHEVFRVTRLDHLVEVRPAAS